MIGRKTKCTPETIKAVTDNIILGLSNRDACANSGITEATFYGWLKRGRTEFDRVSESAKRKVRKREQPFLDFFEAVKKAVPKRKQVLIGRIQRAAAGGEEYTETYRKFQRDKEGKSVLIEERVTTKMRAPEWTAAAWLLERIHYDEFGKRQRVDIHDWRREVKGLLDSGAVTELDVIESLGDDLAREFFESVGLDFIGVGTPTQEEKNDTN